MKRSTLILLVIISIFTASCAAPSPTLPPATNTSLPTAMQTPEPSITPTDVYTPTPVQEVVSFGGNLRVVLGEKVDGGTVIEKFVLDPAMTTEQQDFLYDQLNGNAEKLGLNGTWIQMDDNRILFVSNTDPANILAERKMVEKVNRVEVVWDWAEIEQLLLEKGKHWDMDGVVPVDIESIIATNSENANNIMMPHVDTILASVDDGIDSMMVEGAVFAIDETYVSIYKYWIFPQAGAKPTRERESYREGYVATKLENGDEIFLNAENIDWKWFK